MGILTMDKASDCRQTSFWCLSFLLFLEKNGCFNAETTPSGQNKKAFLPSF